MIKACVIRLWAPAILFLAAWFGRALRPGGGTGCATGELRLCNRQREHCWIRRMPWNCAVVWIWQCRPGRKCCWHSRGTPKRWEACASGETGGDLRFRTKYLNRIRQSIRMTRTSCVWRTWNRNPARPMQVAQSQKTQAEQVQRTPGSAGPEDTGGAEPDFATAGESEGAVAAGRRAGRRGEV